MTEFIYFLTSLLIVVAVIVFALLTHPFVLELLFVWFERSNAPLKTMFVVIVKSFLFLCLIALAFYAIDAFSTYVSAMIVSELLH